MTRGKTQPWSTWVALAGLVVNAAVWSWLIIDRSRFPDGYAARHHVGPWPYPTDGVAVSVAALALETALAAVLMWRSSTSRRAFVVAGAYGLGFGALLLFAMHAPTFLAGHVGALLFAAGWLVVIGLWRWAVERGLLARRNG